MESLHFLECKDVTYYATKTANQNLSRKNRYLQSSLGEKMSLLQFE